ncbi:hypothetical protein [Candidatus Amarolinea dominans]|uniref:hypothetical protein n=1 Tax=Candidatus Amarolinea dominans TaxID=3140696 RepID=UPI0031CCB87E
MTVHEQNVLSGQAFIALVPRRLVSGHAHQDIDVEGGADARPASTQISHPSTRPGAG